MVALHGTPIDFHDELMTPQQDGKTTSVPGFFNGLVPHRYKPPQPFTQEWAEGQAMTLEQAVAYALEEIPDAE